MAAAIWKPEMSTKPKLVIGANGYLGSHVTRQLVAEGHEGDLASPVAMTLANECRVWTRIREESYH